MSIWKARAFLAERTGWDFNKIDLLFYPEFYNLIRFYSSPETFDTPTKSADYVKRKTDEIKRINEAFSTRV